MSTSRNPTWSRDELILALDIYFRIRPQTPGPALPAIVELSRELNRMAERTGGARPANYRSPAAVVMKLMNFRSFDEQYPGEGLSAAGRTDRVVWDDFSEDRERLTAVAQAIRLVQQAPASEAAYPFDDIEEAIEGATLTRMHRAKERSPRLVQAKKRDVLRRTGKLECEICGFDFFRTYGERGRGYIECHHVRPLAALRPGTRTRLADLALVCANCHCMLHGSRPWPTIEQLETELRISQTIGQHGSR